MTAERWLIALIPIAYLGGSIPFGLIVGLSKGVDPRKAGSGNIGVTNVGRLLGKKTVVFGVVLALVKGLVPTLARSWGVGRRLAEGPGDQTVYLLWLAVGFAAILGHMFS